MQENVALDDTDLRLLQTLEARGGLTNAELAEIVLLSPSQCSRRRQRLEEAGIIRGYRAELDAQKLGLGLMVFVQVILRTHNPDNAKRFLALVESVPQIEEAYMLSGDCDYLLKVRIADLEVLTGLITSKLLPHESVERVRSNIVLQSLKQQPSLAAQSPAFRPAEKRRRAR